MKEALLKKRYGIPAFILVILMASGAAAASGFIALRVDPVIRYPTHQSLAIDLGDIPTGASKSGTVVGFLGLPNEYYNLSWSLSGDLEKFSSVSVRVRVDLDDNGVYEESETIGYLTKDTLTISRLVHGVLETKVRYNVLVTAKNDVERAGTSIVSESATLNIDWNASKA